MRRSLCAAPVEPPSPRESAERPELELELHRVTAALALALHSLTRSGPDSGRRVGASGGSLRVLGSEPGAHWHSVEVTSARGPLSVIECQCDSDPRATGGPAPGSRAQRGRLEVNSDVPDAGVPATTTVRSASVAHRDVRRLMVPAHVQHSGVLRLRRGSVRRVFKFAHSADASTIGTRESNVQMARSHREFTRRSASRATPIASIHR